MQLAIRPIFSGAAVVLRLFILGQLFSAALARKITKADSTLLHNSHREDNMVADQRGGFMPTTGGKATKKGGEWGEFYTASLCLTIKPTDINLSKMQLSKVQIKAFSIAGYMETFRKRIASVKIHYYCFVKC